MSLLLLLLACVGTPQMPVETWDPAQKDLVRLQLVETLVERGRDDAALVAIGTLRAEGVDPTALDLLQARALMGLGLYTEAIGILEAGSRRWGGSERWAVLGLAYFGARDLHSAIAALEHAIKLAERKSPAALPELYNNLGFALDSAGRTEDAIAAYRSALMLNPAFTRARNNLGFALVAMHRDDEALASFQAAERLTMRPADAWYNLGLARQLRGDDAQAQEAFEQALGLDPSHERALAALAALQTPETPTESP